MPLRIALMVCSDLRFPSAFPSPFYTFRPRPQGPAERPEAAPPTPEPTQTVTFLQPLSLHRPPDTAKSGTLRPLLAVMEGL